MRDVSETPEKTIKTRIKQTSDKHKGDDMYRVGLTRDMHGKAKGGHPTIRAQEMKGC